MTTLSVHQEVTLRIVECGECGVAFGMTSLFYDKRREDHRGWWCPNGHQRHYAAESDAERYKRLYEQSERRAGVNYDRAESAERSLRSTRGVVTRMQKRAAVGVCPFGCRRHFVNVERHMARKHPGQVAPTTVGSPDG